MASVFKWLGEHKEFSEQYVRAREAQADALADEIVDIADSEENPAKARVRVDARKWIAAKMKPKRYGDKITTEHEGTVEVRHNRIERLIVQPSGEAKLGEAG